MLEKTQIIDYQTACDFLLPRHYSGRKPSISLAFGWYVNDVLVAVATFGKPASPPLCVGVCGKENASHVYELNRLCRLDEATPPLSKFLGECLRYIAKHKQWIVVSYSDTAMHHTGYIYQATNFIYTGMTRPRTDKYTDGNKHCRHYDNGNQQGKRKVRSAKHRYIYFATNDKKQKKTWQAQLKYSVSTYPKTPNENYVLGEFLQPLVIDSTQEVT